MTKTKRSKTVRLSANTRQRQAPVQQRV